MKTKLITIAVFLTAFITNAQEFKFEKETIDYGKVAESSNGTRIFEFTNVGDSPIIIKKIVSTCGCAIPKKPEKPIMPNETGQIEVSYDTKRVGGFSKAITIFSNAKNERKVLKIKGYVNQKKEKVVLSTQS